MMKEVVHEMFLKDIKTQDAVLRNIEIIYIRAQRSILRLIDLLD